VILLFIDVVLVISFHWDNLMIPEAIVHIRRNVCLTLIKMILTKGRAEKASKIKEGSHRKGRGPNNVASTQQQVL
jgi:hypothetical protein